MAEETRVNGTILTGDDGAVYFIPDDALESFRVPDEAAEPARDSVEGEVAGFSVSDRKLVPGVEPLHAFRGPLGIVRAGQNSVNILMYNA